MENKKETENWKPYFLTETVTDEQVTTWDVTLHQALAAHIWKYPLLPVEEARFLKYCAVYFRKYATLPPADTQTWNLSWWAKEMYTELGYPLNDRTIKPASKLSDWKFLWEMLLFYMSKYGLSPLAQVYMASAFIVSPDYSGYCTSRQEMRSYGIEKLTPYMDNWALLQKWLVAENLSIRNTLLLQQEAPVVVFMLNEYNCRQLFCIEADMAITNAEVLLLHRPMNGCHRELLPCETLDETHKRIRQFLANYRQENLHKITVRLKKQLEYRGILAD